MPENDLLSGGIPEEGTFFLHKSDYGFEALPISNKVKCHIDDEKLRKAFEEAMNENDELDIAEFGKICWRKA